MDQATLVGPDLSVGREIVSTLESAGVKQIIALFALFPEYSDWRLVLSSPSLDQNRSLKAGEKVHEILHGKFDYSLPVLMILPAKDSFIRGLRKSLGDIRDGSSPIRRPVYIHLGGLTAGKRYVTDAYIISFPGIVS
jgi:hypothetical protein